MPASSLASTTGLRWGSRMMPLARRMRSVAPARKASAATVSTMRVRGSSGEGGACGSMATTCSPVQSDSKLAASAARATRRMASRRDNSPALMP